MKATCQRRGRRSEVGGQKASDWQIFPTSERRAPSAERRPAFTMIELLMVITVIALLMAISGMVLGNVLNNARIKATEATITKVNGMVQQRQEAIQRATDKKTTKAAYGTGFSSALFRGVERGDLNAAVTLLRLLTRTDMQSLTSVYRPEIDPTILNRASDRTWEVLGRKLCYRMKFPMSFSEVCGFNGKPGGLNTDDDSNSITDFRPSSFQYHSYPDPGEFAQYPAGTSDYDKDDLEPYATLIRERMTTPENHQAETESSELLYLMLTAGDIPGAAPVGSDEFSTSEVKDTDGDGLLEFVDGWGRPLRFFRWPTRLLRCGEDAFTGDTNGDGSSTSAGPFAWPDPRYANMLIGTLPSLTKNDESLRRDPEDGFGSIYTQVIKANTTSGFTPDGARIKLERLFHTQETFHTFLIVSAGPDKDLGLYEPVQFDVASNVMGHLAQPTTLGDPSASPLADNITNRRK